MVCLRQKPKISYPCSWSYKIIAQKREQIEEVVEDICISKEYELKYSNNSKSGKYVSMNFTITVNSDEERVEIFNRLKQHQDITMVL